MRNKRPGGGGEKGYKTKGTSIKYVRIKGRSAG